MKAVFFEALPYESAYRVGSHQYADRFSRAGWDVFWLSHPISLLHILHPSKRDMDTRMRGWREGPFRTGEVTYYSPFTLLPSSDRPILRSRFVAYHSAKWTVPSVKRVLHRAGFDAPDLVWLSNPVFQPIAKETPALCHAIRVADATTSFQGVPAVRQELEEEAVASADVVFAVSEKVRARFAKEREYVIPLPNGAEFTHFAQLRDEPADLRDIPHPRVIYVGAIDYWFDVELVARVAEARPELNFVLIGPKHVDTSALEALSNVHLLGPRPYDQVPAYLQHADVAIIPFARDDMVDAIHPIKAYEYLAAGLPVVATRWPELESMAAPLLLADREEFAELLDDALADCGPSRETRLRYARENSWDARFDTVIETLHPAALLF